MAFTSDTFTGTAGTTLTAHTGETGASWTRHPNDAGAETFVITDANRLRANSAAGTGCQFYASGVPSSPDYDVSFDLVVKSLITGDFIEVAGRCDTVAWTHYRVTWDEAGQQFILVYRVNGSGANLATFSKLLVVGTTYALTLRMRGSAISVLLDGATIMSVTDTQVTAAGRVLVSTFAGVAAQTNTTGVHLDNLIAEVDAPRTDGKIVFRQA
tara:strand:- start:2078 stop:2716 length:639 start_codon:yes stop_codon:yes gene_type:complete